MEKGASDGAAEIYEHGGEEKMGRRQRGGTAGGTHPVHHRCEEMRGKQKGRPLRKEAKEYEGGIRIGRTWGSKGAVKGENKRIRSMRGGSGLENGAGGSQEKRDEHRGHSLSLVDQYENHGSLRGSGKKKTEVKASRELTGVKLPDGGGV